MSTIDDLRTIRINKMKELKKSGINPYPSSSNRSDSIKNILLKNIDEEVSVAGRIVSIRKHGSVCFFDVKDMSGVIQIYIKKDELKDNTGDLIGFQNLDLLDLGDFIEVKGITTLTQSKQFSVLAKEIKILTKAIRGLPLGFDGLKNKEERLRKRYIDLNINKEVFDRFVRRSQFWEAHREFFRSNEFLEMTTPVLEMVPGGADAKPFVTHMEAIHQDFYLRISQELYLKRLIGGGYEKVFEIGPRFRNEGMSDEHTPEHIAMEFYMAYSNYKDGMEFVKNLLLYVVDKVYGKTNFSIRGFNVDISNNWDIVDYTELLYDKYKLDIFNTNMSEITHLLDENKIDYKQKEINVNRGIDLLWKKIRATIAGPVFIVHEPKFLSPLAKSCPEKIELTERFHPIIAGSEIGNGFSELNDPIDQLERFNEQEKLREAGDDEAQMLDMDFVEMLEYGMPPTFGYGHTERVFWFLEDVPAKEGVIFPLMKRE